MQGSVQTYQYGLHTDFCLCYMLVEVVHVDWRAMMAAGKLTDKQLKQAEKIRCAAFLRVCSYTIKSKGSKGKCLGR